MAQRLPNCGAKYSDDILDTFAGARRRAATFGVGEKYLALTSDDYLKDPVEQYDIHNYATLDIQGTHTRITVPYAVQRENALHILDNGILWAMPSGIIVVNSPYVLDGNSKEPFFGADGFIAHLICSLAHRISVRKGTAKQIEVSYLNANSLDFSREYDLVRKHTVVLGPITDYFLSSDFNSAIQTLHILKHHTIILHTATKDLGALLEKMRINVSSVDYFFNFDVRSDAKVASVQEEKKKVERKEKAVGTRTRKKIKKDLNLD